MTFAPPKITKNGLVGFSTALAKYSNSFFIKYPAALIGRSIPTIEEWALCAVPNASLTNKSPSSVNYLRKSFTLFLSALNLFPYASTPFPSSSTWNLKFSSKNTFPLPLSKTVSLTSVPTQSFKKLTLEPRFDSNVESTGLSECFSTLFPSGLPRWDMRVTDFGFCSKIFFIVGMASYILVESFTLPSLRGTLKSTLTSTLLLVSYLNI